MHSFPFSLKLGEKDGFQLAIVNSSLSGILMWSLICHLFQLQQQHLPGLSWGRWTGADDGWRGRKSIWRVLVVTTRPPHGTVMQWSKVTVTELSSQRGHLWDSDAAIQSDRVVVTARTPDGTVMQRSRVTVTEWCFRFVVCQLVASCTAVTACFFSYYYYAVCIPFHPWFLCWHAVFIERVCVCVREETLWLRWNGEWSAGSRICMMQVMWPLWMCERKNGTFENMRSITAPHSGAVSYTHLRAHETA